MWVPELDGKNAGCGRLGSGTLYFREQAGNVRNDTRLRNALPVSSHRSPSFEFRMELEDAIGKHYKAPLGMEP